MLDSTRLTLILPHAQRDTPSWFHSAVYFPSIGSTNTELIQQTQLRNTAGMIFLTEHQTQGRGRLGRPWIALPGEQLAMSYAVPLASFTNPSLLPLTVGLAVHTTIRNQGVDCSLKWPNDILLQKNEILGKGVGILVEISACPSTGKDIAIMGMGINIALSEETKSMISAAYPAQSLSDILGRETVQNSEFIYAFFGQLTQFLAEELTVLQHKPEDIITRYNAHCTTVRRDITVHCAPQSQIGIYAQKQGIVKINSQALESISYIIPAYAHKVACNGELILEISGQEFRINTADIEHIRF